MSKGFWVNSEHGPVHILGDSDMPEETVQALVQIMGKAAEQAAEVQRKFDHLWSQYPFGDKETAFKWFERGYSLRVHEENQ